ncbi:MAG: hypothetical protein QX189_17345 [Methylococcales bacterium]
MFCRNCGKELSDKAVACTGCGMNPHDGASYCPACGGETKDKQIICIACGGDLADKGNNTEVWSTGAYIGLIALSAFIPLVGFIYGGIQVNKATKDSKRQIQAWHFVIAGIVGFVLYVASGQK